MVITLVRSSPEAEALHGCVKKGDLPLLQQLLQARADPDAVDNVGQVPLHRAAHRVDVAMTRALLSAKADANATTRDSRTALHKAAISNYTRFGDWTPELCESRQDNIQKSVQVARLLLEARADPNIQSGNKDTSAARHRESPLHVAATLGRAELATLLIESGADTGLLTQTGLTARDNAEGRGVAEGRGAEWMPGWRSERGAAQAAEALAEAGAPFFGFKVGDAVVLKNLRSRPELNGQAGRLQTFVASKDRWQVMLQSASVPLGVKAENLAFADAQEHC
eukprot:CAMPEP_0204585770 /NCGR_PEP_ID=MMETSP0661-20131031/47110_1 /ASSEMBLY_ACC=CAM_ASM_000606 /TAXON_ID=109239 /ORGANISM="Alexandrium margalefi, Strain AMGDE01CS-322" /LENGTH=280 /DNA_ID=CAMNT_0051595355 /DNA_START=24 /DNA_END=866 /DNA_ORIENTATION=+